MKDTSRARPLGTAESGRLVHLSECRILLRCSISRVWRACDTSKFMAVALRDEPGLLSRAVRRAPPYRPRRNACYDPKGRVRRTPYSRADGGRRLFWTGIRSSGGPAGPAGTVPTSFRRAGICCAGRGIPGTGQADVEAGLHGRREAAAIRPPAGRGKGGS